MSEAQATNDPAPEVNPEANQADGSVVDAFDAFIARGKAFLAGHLAAQPFRANPAFEDLHALGEGILRFLVNEQARAQQWMDAHAAEAERRQTAAVQAGQTAATQATADQAVQEPPTQETT